MSNSRTIRIIGVVFMLLSLVVVSPVTGIAGTPPDAPDVQALEAPPEIRAGGTSYGYFESPIAAGRTTEGKEILSPSAVEGQPRELDWTPVRRVAVRPGYPQTLYATIDNWHGLWRSTDGGVLWAQMPFGVGNGRAIVFANSSTAVATFGYYDSDIFEYVNGGIWRTDDGGNTWKDLSAGIDNMVVAVAFDPGNPNRMYASTYGGGIYRGDYSGGTVAWLQKNSGLVAGETWIYSIAVSPSPAYSNILYAGGYDEVYRSEDYGENWIVADSAYPSDYIEGLAIAPGNGDTWYTGARRMDESDSTLTYGGFYKSTTGAGTNALVLKNAGMTETFVLDIAQDPVHDNILYAGTWGSGVFRSDDWGFTWDEKNAYLGIPYIYGIEAVEDPYNPGTTILYLANFYDGVGFYTSTDRGDTWTDPLYPYVLPEKFDITTTTDAYNLAVATGQGVIFSDDGGATWWISHDLTEYENGIVLELAPDPYNGSKLLAATYGGGIWTSTDAGRNWTETSAGIGGGAYVFDVAFSSTVPNTAYAASYGVYRTTDGGTTWAPFGAIPHYVRDVDGHNDSTSYLFAGTDAAGVYRSSSTSPGWTAINTGLGEDRIRSLKALAWDQVFAGTNGRSAWEYGGSSWVQRGPSIRAPSVIQIAIHPSDPLTIYAGTDQGVYKSTDGGETWTPKNQGLGGYGSLVISGISIDPSNPSTIYLGTWGYGIYKSTDNGDHWTRLSDPLKCTKTYLPLVMKNHGSPFVPLLNGDFEQGSSVGWGQYADHGYNIIRYEGDTPVDAHSGTWLTWLGGDYDNFSVIWQDATIPASDPWIRFYHWDASEDYCGYDYGYVFVNTVEVAYWDLCEDNNTGGWVWSGVDLSAYAGQTVEVAIGSYTDGSLNSNSFIDDVTLGYFASSDLGVQQAPPDIDESALLLMLPDLGGAQKFTSEPPFRPSGDPGDLPGLVDLSD